MKIELRRISHNQRLSQETNAYAADVYIDGKKAGTARNGADYIEPRELRTKLDEYGKTLPPVEAYGTSLTQNAETLLGDLLDQHLTEKEYRRRIGRGILTIHEGKVWAFKQGANTAAILARYPGTLILNDMSFEAGLALYVAHASAAG
jgi:hypothetical protein